MKDKLGGAGIGIEFQINILGTALRALEFY